MAKSAAPAVNMDNPSYPELIAAEIMRTEHFAVGSSKDLYYYDKGVYVKDAHGYIDELIPKVLSRLKISSIWSTALLEGVYKYIYVQTRNRRLAIVPNPEIINLRNGLFNLNTRKLEKHDHSFLSPVRIDITYDPSARCPEILKYLDSIVDKDTVDTICEFLGLYITTDNSIQKIIMLIGSGANGKSTFLEFVKQIIGQENISYVPLHDFGEDKYALAELYMRLVNIWADVSDSDINNTGQLKSITGSDQISGQHKFGHRFNFHNFARLLFSCNNMPRPTRDTSDAFYRRWVFIPFNRKFNDGQQTSQRDIIRKVTTDAEKSGLLNLMLDGYYRLKRNMRFTQSEAMQDKLDEFSGQLGFAKIWIEQNVVSIPGKKMKISIPYEIYKQECMERGRGYVTEIRFNKLMKQIFPALTDPIMTQSKLINNQKRKMYRTWEGLTMNISYQQQAERMFSNWISGAEK